MNANKRILCILMALVLCMSTAVIAVSAEGDLCQLNPMYKDIVFKALGWEGNPDGYACYEYSCEYIYNADGSKVLAGATPDYALVVAHDNTVSPWEYRETIGNYKLNHVSGYNPYPTGYVIYSFAEDKIYSIREAWNLRLPQIETVLEILGTKVTLYAEAFEEYLAPRKDSNEENSVYGWYAYEELYYYNADNGGTTEMPEATPDYVLADACAYHCPPANVTEMFGDYVVYCGWGNPGPLRYFVYTPEDGRIYTLQEACDSELQGIMNVFSDYGLGRLMGDMDDDNRLTIKDATYIQKHLAKFEGFSLYEADTGIPDWVTVNIADFDGDNDVNIKDATAIQKRLAKII